MDTFEKHLASEHLVAGHVTVCKKDALPAEIVDRVVVVVTLGDRSTHDNGV